MNWIWRAWRLRATISSLAESQLESEASMPAWTNKTAAVAITVLIIMGAMSVWLVSEIAGSL